MNRSAAELGLWALAAPNFTLCADTANGLRPSFGSAAGHELARPAFELFAECLGGQGLGGVVLG
jgi:D-Tyr-tRNAtyr deacylase